MLSRATFDQLLIDVLAPLTDSTLAVLVCDATQPNPPIIRVNDAFTDLTGYAATEAVGRNLDFLAGPLTEPNALSRLFQTARTGARATGKMTHYRRNRSPFLNKLVISPIHDHTGALRFHTVVNQEIPAAGDAAASCRRIRFALTPGVGLRATAVQNGMPDEWLDRVPRGDRARLAHAAQSCAARGSNLSISVRCANEAGKTADAMLQADLVRDPAQPEVLIYEGTLCEPSGAMQLAARLRLLEAVMTHANDVIIITEAEPFELPGPRILYVNDAITRHTGHRPEQLLGRTPRYLQGPLTNKVDSARFGQALRRWESCSATLLNYRADGSTFWNEISCTPMADEHGWWTNWIAIQRDITERKQVAEHVTFLAEHDPLTGLANRRLAGSRLAEGLHAATHAGVTAPAACGVVKIDLDHFKPINDTYGHAAGDAVLAEVAIRLNAVARGSDTVARIGGDEFMVVLPGLTNRPDLQMAAARLLDRVAGPFLWNGRKLAINASVGCALYPEDADEPDGLLAAADIALYRAKARGRGRAHVFSEELRIETAEVRQIGGDLQDAVERGEFVVFLQPKVNLASRRLIGFEALVRWRHPRKGLLSPQSFIAVAENCGLIRTIDSYVVEQVAGFAGMWAKAGIDFGRIAVNVSAASFAEPDFVQILRDRLDRAGMAPAHLTVEVVESIFISDRAGGVIDKLDELRRMGVRIELDDFGTGYAALAHLRAFKVDGIKLDGSFVRGLGTDREDEIITGAIVGLARNLGLGCVAEGIEHERQAKFLLDLGCENGQGYLFGAPADEAAATALLTRLTATRMVLPVEGAPLTMVPA